MRGLLLLFFTLSLFANDAQIKRIKDFQAFFLTTYQLSPQEKLLRTNFYFNQIYPQYDNLTRNSDDIWNTPLEFLLRGGGDCEEYAMTKYFVLNALGIDKKYLYLMVVYEQTSGFREMHLVLAYYKNLQTTPFILDNLSSKILTLKARTDLKPILIFNEKQAYSIDTEGIPTTQSQTPFLKKFQSTLLRHQKQKIRLFPSLPKED